MLHSCVWKDTVAETHLFCWLCLQNNVWNGLLHLKSGDFSCEWLPFLLCFFFFFNRTGLFYGTLPFSIFQIVSKYFHVVSVVRKFQPWNVLIFPCSSYWIKMLIVVLFRYQKWTWRHLGVVSMLNLEHHQLLVEVLHQPPVPSGKSLFKLKIPWNHIWKT